MKTAREYFKVLSYIFIIWILTLSFMFMILLNGGDAYINTMFHYTMYKLLYGTMYGMMALGGGYFILSLFITLNNVASNAQDENNSCNKDCCNK